MTKYNTLHPVSFKMRNLLFHAKQKNVKPNSVPANIKNTIVAYSFGNTINQISKSRFIEPEINQINLSQYLINLNKISNTNVSILVITQDENKYIKSFLRKEYPLYLSYGDRSHINKYIINFFLALHYFISEPHYLITSNKIKISFYYYSLYENHNKKRNKRISIRKFSYKKFYNNKWIRINKYKKIKNKKYSLRNRGIKHLFYSIKKKNI